LGIGGGVTGTDSVQTRHGEYLSSFSGELYQANVSASYRNGNFGVTVVAAGAMGEWDTARHVQVDGFEQTYSSFDGITIDPVLGELPAFSDKTIVFEGINGIATSTATLYALNPRLRLSHTATMGALEVLSYLDVDGHIMYTPERAETGVGLANLVYPEMTQSIVTLTPGVQVSVSRALDNGLVVRGFARGEVMVSPFAENWSALTQFAAAPAGLPPIEMIEPFDSTRLGIDLGLSVGCPASGLNLQVNYGGVFGQTTVEHAIKGGLHYRFGGPAGRGC
jgi:hypothetical protein